jgi:hemerythrin
VQHVEELYTQLKSVGFTPELAREVNYYIIEWFVDHIRQADMELVEFLHTKVTWHRKIFDQLNKLFTSLFGKN